eukprot:949254-Pyramimonas_sp.AAC.1
MQRVDHVACPRRRVQERGAPSGGAAPAPWREQLSARGESLDCASQGRQDRGRGKLRVAPLAIRAPSTRRRPDSDGVRK